MTCPSRRSTRSSAAPRRAMDDPGLLEPLDGSCQSLRPWPSSASRSEGRPPVARDLARELTALTMARDRCYGEVGTEARGGRLRLLDLADVFATDEEWSAIADRLARLATDLGAQFGEPNHLWK